MCGIAGIFNAAATAPPVSESALRAMCDTLRHRGPDDDGYFAQDYVGIGMRRLSIVDLSGGHQPMQSANGALQIVFNGEIFNHDALRAELKAAGAQFQTTSDTEVVLRLYEREGVGAFHRLNGMFAIAIADLRDQSLLLVRDRMGVKPLYYSWDGSRLVFASEIKAILAALPQLPEVNPRAVWDYLTFRFVPMPETIWKGISKLPPAHRMLFRQGDRQPSIDRWWSYPSPSRAPTSDGEPVQTFHALLKDAVDIRMRADVPVGILLSGGLDSSVVAALAAPSHPRLSTFSVAFRGAADIDERLWARMVAQKLGTDHQEVEIDDRDFVDFLPDFVHYTDEPLADLASIPLYYVSRLARGSVKVVLSGEGSDEILGGYSFDSWAKRWDAAAAANQISLTDRLRNAVGLARIGQIDPALLDLRRAQQPLTMTAYMTSAEKQALLMQETVFEDSLDGTRRALNSFGDASPLAQALYTYCQDWLVEDLLMKADKMSMATSLELRTPFLDYRVVEMAARLPDAWRVGREADGTYATKRILRHLARDLIPAEIIDRPKMGFPVPVYGWLSDRLKPFAHDLLSSPSTKLAGWCHASGLSAILARGTTPSASSEDRHRLWNTLILELWLRRWTP